MLKKCLFVIMLLVSPLVFSQDKGFDMIAQGKYFTVYSNSVLDVMTLVKKLDTDYFVHLDNVLDGQVDESLEQILAKVVDTLYLKVSDVLDIHMYSFQGTINIVPDQKGISIVFKKTMDKNFHERSFYIKEKNTIYISYEDLTPGMLGHEIAHAIQCNYFVVPPPTKVQEVLAGYVEYSLKKGAN